MTDELYKIEEIITAHFNSRIADEHAIEVYWAMKAAHNLQSALEPYARRSQRVKDMIVEVFEAIHPIAQTPLYKALKEDDR